MPKQAATTTTTTATATATATTTTTTTSTTATTTTTTPKTVKVAYSRLLVKTKIPVSSSVSDSWHRSELRGHGQNF